MPLREKWLLCILSGVFAVQAGTFLWGFNLCARVKPSADLTKVCPDLGRRFDNTFQGMIATTLALLTGSAVIAQKPKTTSTRKTTPPPPK